MIGSPGGVRSPSQARSTPRREWLQRYIVRHPALDPLFQDHESLTAALATSIVGKIAFGPNAGNSVRRIGGGFGYEDEVPLAKGKLCFSFRDDLGMLRSAEIVQRTPGCA